MTQVKTFPFTCPRCGHAELLPEYSSINAEESPELKERILDGSLFSFTCSHCGYSALIRYECVYADQKHQLLIHLPEDPDHPDLSREQDYPGWRIRRVNDPNELMEKILIFEEGLDDRAVELEKHLLEEAIQNEQPDRKIQAMYFMPAEDGYHFAVLSEEGFSGSVPMDHRTYQQIEEEVLPELSERMKASPIINSAWAAFAIGSGPEERGE